MKHYYPDGQWEARPEEINLQAEHEVLDLHADGRATRRSPRYDAAFDPNLDVPFGSPVWVDYQAGRPKSDDCTVLLALPRRQPTWLSTLIWRVRVWWWLRRNPEESDAQALP